ncbi:PREDICTED: uncharacterized protein LOC103582292 [Galeopterus variegatus]|uniref:Uncharacterized protein LOC103582292 n=1 Tax=Galeopterus variegatus TaxID=482537 RepID=A0ABM0Q1B4_GALVR|nr:PREDICTED: uncharacterized protein LOC103582292 [Galeopterus variegatus]
MLWDGDMPRGRHRVTQRPSVWLGHVGLVLHPSEKGPGAGASPMGQGLRLGAASARPAQVEKPSLKLSPQTMGSFQQCPLQNQNSRKNANLWAAPNFIKAKEPESPLSRRQRSSAEHPDVGSSAACVSCAVSPAPGSNMQKGIRRPLPCRTCGRRAPGQQDPQQQTAPLRLARPGRVCFGSKRLSCMELVVGTAGLWVPPGALSSSLAEGRALARLPGSFARPSLPRGTGYQGHPLPSIAGHPWTPWRACGGGGAFPRTGLILKNKIRMNHKTCH